MPEFAHIRSSRILVVAGEARRASRATVKPLVFSKKGRASRRAKAVVRIKGRRMLYCITLRPLFFRASTPKARIGTFLHELFHISPEFDGSLHPGRRHDALGKKFTRRLRPLVRRYLHQCPPELWAAFAHNGEVRVQQWLERPSISTRKGANAKRLYTEADLFFGPVRMVTQRARPATLKPPSRVH
jgi:hypothetical protein